MHGSECPRKRGGVWSAACHRRRECGGQKPPPPPPPPPLAIHVISDRADVISAGDVLASVDLPTGVAPGSVRVTDNGRDVTSAFAMRANGLYEGLVTGLDLGSNLLSASAPGASSAQIAITNHPNGGPVFSGPQVQPWVCQNADATDAQCNAPVTYSYQYKSSVTGQFAAYDPGSPPSDVASTTTDNGQTVPTSSASRPATPPRSLPRA